MDITLARGTPLSSITVGQFVKLNESGSPVEFYVAKHDYETTLNGAGRTLLLRRFVHSNQIWNATQENSYATSSIDTWFNGTYKNLLDTGIQTVIGTTKFKYTISKGNNTTDILERSIFALSGTELGGSGNWVNIEGYELPISGLLRKAYQDNTTTSNQWTRSPMLSNYQYVAYYDINAVFTNQSCIAVFGARPCFTLPGTISVDSDNNIIVP